MKLYHGSNVDIREIDLTKSLHGKDFGQGFYLSADEKQAEEMAIFKAKQFDGTPVISTFQHYFGTERAINLLHRL